MKTPKPSKLKDLLFGIYQPQRQAYNQYFTLADSIHNICIAFREYQMDCNLTVFETQDCFKIQRVDPCEDDGGKTETFHGDPYRSTQDQCWVQL